jgi:hypothetical protein
VSKNSRIPNSEHGREGPSGARKVLRKKKSLFLKKIYSVETTYGINSVISKLMTFVENAETGQFLFMIMLILSSFTCS